MHQSYVDIFGRSVTANCAYLHTYVASHEVQVAADCWLLWRLRKARVVPAWKIEKYLSALHQETPCQLPPTRPRKPLKPGFRTYFLFLRPILKSGTTGSGRKVSASHPTIQRPTRFVRISGPKRECRCATWTGLDEVAGFSSLSASALRRSVSSGGRCFTTGKLSVKLGVI